MTFARLKWNNMPKEVEVGMFELQAQLLKTRLFDEVRHLEVPNRQCRVCHKHEETIPHLVTGCEVWFFTYYLQRHNAALKPLCWWLRKRYGLDDVMKAWHDRTTPDPISDNDNICIWWDLPVFFMGEESLEHNRPDMRVWLKREGILFVVEMATPWDGYVAAREGGKQTRYEPLCVELAKEYQGKVKVNQVSLVVGALGTVVSLEEELGKIVDVKKDVRVVAERMQRATVCATLRTINKFKALCLCP